MVGKFGIGQHVRVKKGVTWLPVPPGSKLTIIRTGLDTKVLYCKAEAGSFLWVNADDLEPVEDGNCA